MSKKWSNPKGKKKKPIVRTVRKNYVLVFHSSDKKYHLVSKKTGKTLSRVKFPSSLNKKYTKIIK